MKIDCEGEKTEVWLIFIYGSTDNKERQEQWNFLNAKKQLWGKNWVMGETSTTSGARRKSKEAKRDMRAVFVLSCHLLQRWIWGKSSTLATPTLGQVTEWENDSFRNGWIDSLVQAIR